MARKNVLTRGKKRKADQLASDNKLAEAKALWTSICRIDPLDGEAWAKLSAIHRRLGELADAVTSGRRAVDRQPGLAFAHYVLAAGLDCTGKVEEALTSYRRALQLKPDFAVVHYLMGNALQRIGRIDDAVASWRTAIGIQPDFFEALCNLGSALITVNLMDDGAIVLKKALALRPHSTAPLLNLAVVAERADRIEDAIACYEQALRNDPDAIDVLAGFAALLEKLGRCDAAKPLIARGLALAPAHPLLSLAAARVARRQGRIQEAAELLEALDDHGTANSIAGEVKILLGQLYDQLGQPERAFPLFVEGNRRTALATPTSAATAERYLATLDTWSQYLNPAFVAAGSSNDQLRDDAPIFLVGFPRSGTTLLEQILDSHPALQTLEEKPAAAAMERAFLDLADAAPGRNVVDLGSKQVSHLRQLYHDEVARHLKRDPGSALVDKLPLNIVRVPMIWRVFPNARFILALRHPYDVCLSCFMQSFAINDAMANFFTLEDTARLYVRVMQLWKDYARALPLRYCLIRYEDLIGDVEGEARRLLDFLGVGWDDAVLGHTTRARERRSINTPSYHQVTQPVYQRAKERWKHYANDLEPVMPLLRPFVEHFGYTV